MNTPADRTVTRAAGASALSLYHLLDPEVLTIGASDEEGRVILLAPDTPVPLGARIH